MLTPPQIAYTIFCVIVIVLAHQYKQTKNKEKKELSRLEEMYQSVQNPISAQKEKTIKIKNMFIYPIASVRACEVDHLDISPLGIKYDRVLTIYDVEKTIMLTNCDHLAINSLR